MKDWIEMKQNQKDTSGCLVTAIVTSCKWQTESPQPQCLGQSGHVSLQQVLGWSTVSLTCFSWKSFVYSTNSVSCQMKNNQCHTLSLYSSPLLLYCKGGRALKQATWRGCGISFSCNFEGPSGHILMWPALADPALKGRLESISRDPFQPLNHSMVIVPLFGFVPLPNTELEGRTGMLIVITSYCGVEREPTDTLQNIHHSRVIKYILLTEPRTLLWVYRGRSYYLQWPYFMTSLVTKAQAWGVTKGGTFAFCLY